MSTPGEGIGECHDYLVCPYNPAHLIESYRMQQHLTKCRIQHMKTDTKVCPYDVKHIVPEGELDNHIKTCPARFMLDRVKYNVDPTCDQLPAPAPAPNVPSAEDWEDETFPGYKPREIAAKNKNIIRKLPGVTPSERRAFRMEQRKNYAQE